MSTYIVAVSGGIDSVVMLDMLSRSDAKHRYIVAHVNHGIRVDSGDDEEFVAELAGKYQLAYESTKLELGTDASEEAARDARYQWLNQIRDKYDAKAIVTAHHQDDAIETAIINIIRGTGWRGIASLRSTSTVKRPLIDVSKAELVRYAIDHKLVWHEDSTNQDVTLLRNYVRHLYMPRLSSELRQSFLDVIKPQSHLRDTIETEAKLLVEAASSKDGLPRQWLIMVDPGVQREVVYAWSRCSLQTAQWNRLRRFTATAKPSAEIELGDGKNLGVTKDSLVVYR